MSRSATFALALLAALALVWVAPALGQAVGTAILHVRRIYGIGGSLEVVGALQADPVLTSTVRVPDGGVLSLDAGGVRFPEEALGCCSLTTNYNVHKMFNGFLFQCGGSSPTAWRVVQGPLLFPTTTGFQGSGQGAVNNVPFAGSLPPTAGKFTDVYCVITRQASGAGNAVVVSVQDGGVLCRADIPCSSPVGTRHPLTPAERAYCQSHPFQGGMPIDLMFSSDGGCSNNPSLFCMATVDGYIEIPCP